MGCAIIWLEDNMIKVENIKKKFVRTNNKKEKQEFFAVNGISFTANENEIIGILGPNGAGKTTLLRMLAGIMEPTSGSVSIDDLSYEKDAVELKKRIAFLSGNTKLYNRVSPYELLKMCGSFYGVEKDILDSRIKEICKVLDLEAFQNNKIGNLSTGQTQRVGIARCLVHNPKYYILDEATSGLDIVSSQVILDFIKEEKKKGKTIIYSTHYMEEAENICDRVIMMNKGQIIATGTPDELRKKTKTKNLREAFFALIGGVKSED